MTDIQRSFLEDSRVTLDLQICVHTSGLCVELRQHVQPTISPTADDQIEVDPTKGPRQKAADASRQRLLIKHT